MRKKTVMRKAAVTRKKSAKVREPERDYSHRLLIDKLGVKPEQKIVVLGVESAEFLTDACDARGGLFAGEARWMGPTWFSFPRRRWRTWGS